MRTKGAMTVPGIIVILLVIGLFFIPFALSKRNSKQTGQTKHRHHSADMDAMMRYTATSTGNRSYHSAGSTHYSSNLFEGDIPLISESIQKMKAGKSDTQRIRHYYQRAEAYIDSWLKPKPVEKNKEQDHIQYSISMSYDEIQQYIDQMRFQSSFSEMVLSIMEKKGVQPKEFCSRALFDRKLFHSLKTGGSNYQPSKDTAIRCCLALRLTSEQTSELLQTAGFSLSRRQKRDLLTRYCIENCIWNLFDVDELYTMMGEKPLIG